MRDYSDQNTDQSKHALLLENFIPYRMNILATLASHNLMRLYRSKYKFGIAEWRVIATLGQFGTATSKTIGEHSQMQKAKVSRAVAVLSRRKIVERKPNKEDLREAFLNLTDHGRSVYAELVPAVLDHEAQLLSVLSEVERVQFRVMLERLTVQAQTLLDAGRKPALGGEA